MALCGELYLEEFMDLLLKTDYVMNEWTYAKHSSNKKCHKFKRSCLMRLFNMGRQLTPT